MPLGEIPSHAGYSILSTATHIDACEKRINLSAIDNIVRFLVSDIEKISNKCIDKLFFCAIIDTSDEQMFVL